MRLGKAIASASKPKASASGKSISSGYGLKHKLRKGTEFQGQSPSDAGVGDQMSDYARMLAAQGGL